MGALMIIQANITNAAQFKEYAIRTPALVEQFGGRYRVMRGEREQLEGPADNRLIVVSQWPSMEAARAFWHSDAYDELRKLRAGAAEVDVNLVEITGD